MNRNTLRNLEFEAIRALLLTRAGSAVGKVRLARLTPFTEPALVRDALANTTEAVVLLRKLGRQPFADLPDITPLLAAARVAGLHLEPAGLMDVASFIDGGLEVARAVAHCDAVPRLSRLASEVADTSGVAAAIRRAILPAGEVASDASPKLAATRRALARLRVSLQSLMESFLRGKEADRLLQDKLITTRNDRFVLLVKAEQRGALPGIVHGSSGSGASFFVEPLPAVELNNDIVSLIDDERNEVLRILRELTARVGEHEADLARMADVLGELDALQAMALTARDMDAVEPEIEDGAPEPGFQIDLREARHPLLLQSVAERLGITPRTKREPVPVSLQVGGHSPALVISGPNTGGKTVALKTVGLLALMAQSGLHIPAAPGSRLPVFRRIYADIGDEQSIAANLSTFSAHLSVIVEMTRDLPLPALVLLDEVGAGTDPTEGGALGVAIVEHFRSQGAMVVATTHHGLMKAYAQSTPGVACASFGYDAETYEPTYRLFQGVAGRSLALEMAERLGLPAAVVVDARTRLDQKQAQAEALLKQLEEQRATLERDQQRLDIDRHELDAIREQQQADGERLAARKRTELESFVRELRRRGEESARKAADAIHAAVLRIETSKKSVIAEASRARSEAVKLIREAQDEILQDPSLGLPAEPENQGGDLAVGMRVRVRNLGVVGDVMALLDHGAAEVAVSGKRLRVKRSELVTTAARSAPAPVQAFAARNAGSGSDEGVSSEINLLGLTVDEALPRVDKLLDDAAIAERKRVRVIHGFGEGRLRKAVAGLLQGHPHVAAFRAGGDREGGGGVTIVELKE